MNDLKQLIDATTFGSVRRCVQAAHSPITTVMLVQHHETLLRAGHSLVADQGSTRTLRRRQWAEWFNTGEIRVGGPPGDTAQVADLDAISDSAICDVLFVPPVYLVCLRGYSLPVGRRASA